MVGLRASLVDIVRDFLTAHRLMRDVFALFRRGLLHFEDIEELVGDGEGSLLFRLKERCHALYRDDAKAPRPATPREALFDLAVGSLFHEAMKFRENLYQTQIYGPKVQLLRGEAGAVADEEAGELFQEFGRILSAAELRLGETLEESEALLAQTAAQFRLLLADYRDDGLVVRFLVEQPNLVGEVVPAGLDELFEEFYGDAADGYLVATRSYLESAHFEKALETLREARGRRGDTPEIGRLTAYAEGMQAFLNGCYAASLERLGHWLDANPVEEERGYAALALNAVSRISLLVDEKERTRLARASAKLARRIEAVAGAAAPS